MGKQTRQQQLHNYLKFMELCKAALSIKAFNTVDFSAICKAAHISTNAPMIMLINGFIEKGEKRGQYRATDRFPVLSAGSLMEMGTNYHYDQKKKVPVKPYCNGGELPGLSNEPCISGPQVYFAGTAQDWGKMRKEEDLQISMGLLLVWEDVKQQGHCGTMFRARVHGGYLYELTTTLNGFSSCSLVYVPIPDTETAITH